jgi:hypothetical protein
MSSNAFARSRPRVRHQRVPKTQCYAHPRFLQLVKELARIEDVKKKQEIEQLNNVGSGTKTRSSVALNNSTSTCVVKDDCSNSTTTSNQHAVSSHRQQHNHHHHNQTRSHPQPPPPTALPAPSVPIQHQQQRVVDCWPINVSLSGASCCRNLNEAHSSNSCGSLECNQLSTLNDTYYRQNNNDNLTISNHSLHQNYQRHYGYTSNHQDTTINNQTNNLSHNSQHDYRCPSSKCSTTLSTPTTANNFGYTKESPIDQNAADFSNSDQDHRQDENRTKRKRSNNDLSNSSSKKSSQPTSPSSCNKRHKASPEPVRPLSPSFTKCPICLLDCMDRDPSFTNTCFHLFCYVCIENWSKSKATCPLCRTKFTKIIYNIRSASCFDEKVASPIRRDDDDDRIIYEQLHGLSANTIGSTRNSSNDETRLLFDNLRNNQHNDLMPHFALLNHSLNRHVSALQSFNSVTTNSNFNPGVPHAPFTTVNYNPVGSSYIALIPSNDRSQATANNGTAITSAYTTNASLTNSSNDSSNRVLPRTSRSGRFIYSRNYDLTTIDGTTRVSRSTNTDINQSGVSLEPRHHHHQMPHGGHHQHHNQHSQQQQQHRATSTIELVPHRQVQRIDQHPHILPYLIPPRHYTNPHMYSRRPYTNPPTEQHILDNLYRQMPDM